jgi:hypothetical protein
MGKIVITICPHRLQDRDERMDGAWTAGLIAKT